MYLLQLSLNVIHVLVTIIADQSKIAVQDRFVTRKPRIGDFLVFSFASEKVHKVNNDTRDHDHFQVVTLPIGPQVHWDVGDLDRLGNLGFGFRFGLFFGTATFKKNREKLGKTKRFCIKKFGLKKKKKKKNPENNS